MEEGKISFDLFSSVALRILTECDSIRNIISSRYPIIIVDEAQDTDDRQWACINAMSSTSQLVFMADLEQQIFDFREGVTVERLSAITKSLNPLAIDLGSQNNRSPDSEILDFGDSLLSARSQDSTFNGVSRIGFRETAVDRDRWIRQSVGIIKGKILQESGESANSIAYLASSNKGVSTIANALRGSDLQNTIPHKISFDETKALLSSRIIAFLLEPKIQENNNFDKAELLRMLSDIASAKGTISGASEASRWRGYADKLSNNEKIRQIKLIGEIDSVLGQLGEQRFSGDPRKDWLLVKSLLLNSADQKLVEVGHAVQYLVSFNRGKAISTGLVDSWLINGTYNNAREIIENALSTEQLIQDDNDVSGLHVMTMHKSKGKQFDGVIIFHEQNICPLTLYHDVAPYEKSKKLLRVAVTRASKHVLLLTGVFRPPALLDGYNF